MGGFLNGTAMGSKLQARMFSQLDAKVKAGGAVTPLYTKLKAKYGTPDTPAAATPAATATPAVAQAAAPVAIDPVSPAPVAQTPAVIAPVADFGTLASSTKSNFLAQRKKSTSGISI